MKSILYILFNLILFDLSAQNILLNDSIRVEKDDNGNVKLVDFISAKGGLQLLTDTELSLLLNSSDSFFKKYFKLSENDEYRLIRRQEREHGFEFERFQQYYKNIKVDDGCYTLQYYNNRIFLAHGNFIKIDQLNIIPGIFSEAAMKAFANYPNIPPEQI